MRMRIEKPTKAVEPVTAADRRTDDGPSVIPSCSDIRIMQTFVNHLLEVTKLLDEWERVRLDKSSLEVDGDRGEVIVRFHIEQVNS